MTHPEFDANQKTILDKVIGMGATKGKEYSNSESRFANFDRVAAELGLTNIQVAWVYTKKHLDGIASYCRTEKEFSEPIEGRIVDAIVYLTLIAGMIEEKRILMSQCEIDKSWNKDEKVEVPLEDANSGKQQPFEYDPTWHPMKK